MNQSSIIRNLLIGCTVAALAITPVAWSIAQAATTAQHSASSGPGGGPGGGLLGGGGASNNDELVSMLRSNASQYRWVAATIGSQNAASYQLASQGPVMAIGGFNGTDNAPTLEQFKEYISQGLIHYYISGGLGGPEGGPNGGPGGRSGSSSEISQWVSQNFSSTTVNNATVYDLTATTSARSANSAQSSDTAQ